MAAEESERVEQQRRSLGEEKLAEKEEQLQKAKEQNEVPCSNDVVSSVPIPGTDCIFFHPLVSVGNHQSDSELESVLQCKTFPLQQLPFFFLLNHIHSCFVEVEPLSLLYPTPLPLSDPLLYPSLTHSSIPL